MPIGRFLLLIGIALLTACTYMPAPPILILEPDSGRSVQSSVRAVRMNLPALFQTRAGTLVRLALPSGESVVLRTKEVIVDAQRSIWIGKPDETKEAVLDTYIVQVGDYVSASIELPGRELVVDGRVDELIVQTAIGKNFPENPDGVPPSKSIFNPQVQGRTIPDPGPVQPVSIRVAVVYTRDLTDSYPHGIFSIYPIVVKAMEIARRAMSNSGTYINLEFSHFDKDILEFAVGPDNESTLRRLTPAQGLNQWNRRTGNLKRIANADILVLLTRHQGDNCGVGWISGYRNQATDPAVDITNSSQTGYAVVNISPNGTTQCHDKTTLAHEIGHVLGSMHDRYTESGNPARGAFEHSFGHRSEGASKFVTIMGYPDASHPRIELFSNSDLQAGCLGSPCGVLPGLPASASNALGFHTVRSKVSQWRYFRDLRVAITNRGTVRASYIDGKPDPGFQVINCPGQCYTTVPPGRRITLQAIPEPGYKFVGWQNSSCSNQPQCHIDAQDVGEIEAFFYPL